MDLAYFFSRFHQIVGRNRRKWARIAQAYAGGEEYIPVALIRHVAENRLEFAERLKRAYYFNYPRRLAELITTYIFSVEPVRSEADTDIVGDWSRSGKTTDAVMQDAAINLNLFGLGWLLVDFPALDGEIDLETKKRQRIRPFVRSLSPQQVPDWYDGADGKLEWAIVEEVIERKSSPYEKPVTVTQRRLWTRTEWILHEKTENGDFRIVAKSAHNLGEVPLVRVEQPHRAGLHINHWFEDVVRISDAILNNESEAQMNIIKQMFGILVVSETFAQGRGQPPKSEEGGEDGKEEERFSHTLARAAALWETAEEKGLTRYIHPDGVPNATIRAENAALKKEMFDVVGMAAQSESREAQTAESKSWDANQVQRFLAARAGLFEQAEQRCWNLMALWDKDVAVPQVSYNRDFSVQELSAMVTSLIDLSTIEAGDEYKREIARVGLDLLDKLRRIAPEKYKIITEEIEKLEIMKFLLPEQQLPPVDDEDEDSHKKNQEDSAE